MDLAHRKPALPLAQTSGVFFVSQLATDFLSPMYQAPTVKLLPKVNEISALSVNNQ